MINALCNKVRTAFYWRKYPSRISIHSDSSASNTDDAFKIAEHYDDDIGMDVFETYGDAFFDFSDEAYNFFLPKLIISSLRSNSGINLPVSSVLLYLDRSPTPEYWDEGLLGTFGTQTDQELEAVHDWLNWLYLNSNDADDRETLERSKITIELIRASR